jgi:hypothetical protein
MCACITCVLCDHQAPGGCSLLCSVRILPSRPPKATACHAAHWRVQLSQWWDECALCGCVCGGGGGGGDVARCQGRTICACVATHLAADPCAGTIAFCGIVVAVFDLGAFRTGGYQAMQTVLSYTAGLAGRYVMVQRASQVWDGASLLADCDSLPRSVPHHLPAFCSYGNLGTIMATVTPTLGLCWHL